MGPPDPAPPQASSQMAAAPLPPLGGIPIVGATPLPAVSFVAPDSVASPNPAPQTQLPPHSLQKAGSSNDSVLSMLMRSAGDLWSGLNRTRKATTPNSLRLSWGSVSSLTADPTTEADDVAVPSLLLNDGASAGGGHATRQLMERRLNHTPRRRRTATGPTLTLAALSTSLISRRLCASSPWRRRVLTTPTLPEGK